MHNMRQNLTLFTWLLMILMCLATLNLEVQGHCNLPRANSAEIPVALVMQHMRRAVT